MTTTKPLTNEHFLRHVRDYLPMDALVWNLDLRGKPSTSAQACRLAENRVYHFDAESVLAASHAIEEIALEEANGTLLAAMQEFRHFEPHRERYWQLAATLSEVRVIARGRRQPRHGHLKFVSTNHKALALFWAVLYQGRGRQAMLICRQANAAKIFEQRRFDGFYSFSPELIALVRQDLEDVLAGSAAGIVEFERLLAVDRAIQRLAAEFTREHKAVESALRKLQTAGVRYQARHFAEDVRKSLNRLKLLTDRLPGHVGAANNRLAT